MSALQAFLINTIFNILFSKDVLELCNRKIRELESNKEMKGADKHNEVVQVVEAASRQTYPVEVFQALVKLAFVKLTGGTY